VARAKVMPDPNIAVKDSAGSYNGVILNIGSKKIEFIDEAVVIAKIDQMLRSGISQRHILKYQAMGSDNIFTVTGNRVMD
jgi:hypothetical protein